MNTEAAIDTMNANALPFISILGGRMSALDTDDKSCTFEFDVPLDLCHTGNIIQGGFVTAMLDTAMSHAVYGLEEGVVNLSSLEITTRYLAAAEAGRLEAVGKITKSSYRTLFLEAFLYDAHNQLLATAQSVAKVSRARE